jgi:polar amino acid transport system substrate-binding protein
MTLKQMFMATTLLAAIAILSAKSVSATSLQDIKAKGEITIAVKEDYPPFGQRNEAGELIGLEIELARDIAARLSVQLKLFPVSSVSRLQFLQENMVDVVLATVAVTKDRRTQAALIEPFYYASSLALLAPENTPAIPLSALNGKAMCTLTNPFYNETLTSLAPRAALVFLRNLREAARALSDKKCAALAGENTQLFRLHASQAERWKTYKVVSLDMAGLPWAIAVKSGQAQSDLGRFLSETVTSWHKGGKLLALEKQWLGRNTKWLLAMHEKLK